jgi:hypothetical protein
MTKNERFKKVTPSLSFAGEPQSYVPVFMRQSLCAKAVAAQPQQKFTLNRFDRTRKIKDSRKKRTVVSVSGFLMMLMSNFRLSMRDFFFFRLRFRFGLRSSFDLKIQ